MLKGIASCISPDLLKALAEMGHGDEIILADAHFPAHTLNPRVVRADGVLIAPLLAGILPLFELDSYADPLVMMAMYCTGCLHHLAGSPSRRSNSTAFI
jgi:L-fucose mutarotase